jgi:circadian clock protein KaiC
LQVSTVADTWIQLSYLARGGERNRALSVIKSRGTGHSDQVRELLLSDEGITLAEVYTAGGEVLMGTLRWEREAEAEAERERVRAEVERRRKELELAEAEAEMRVAVIRRELEARRAELEVLRLREESRELGWRQRRAGIWERRIGEEDVEGGAAGPRHESHHKSHREGEN